MKVDADQKLKDLAKSFVEIAIEKGVKECQLHNLLRKIWNENTVLKKPTPEELEFREKAKKFLENAPYEHIFHSLDSMDITSRKIHGLRYYHEQYAFSYKDEHTSVPLEIFCVAYRFFKSGRWTASKKAVFDETVKILLQKMYKGDYSDWQQFTQKYSCPSYSTQQRILRIVFAITHS